MVVDADFKPQILRQRFLQSQNIRVALGCRALPCRAALCGGRFLSLRLGRNRSEIPIASFQSSFACARAVPVSPVLL